MINTVDDESYICVDMFFLGTFTKSGCIFKKQGRFKKQRKLTNVAVSDRRKV